jgi:hypothetical protein
MRFLRPSVGVRSEDNRLFKMRNVGTRAENLIQDIELLINTSKNLKTVCIEYHVPYNVSSYGYGISGRRRGSIERLLRPEKVQESCRGCTRLLRSL